MGLIGSEYNNDSNSSGVNSKISVSLVDTIVVVIGVNVIII